MATWHVTWSVNWSVDIVVFNNINNTINSVDIHLRGSHNVTHYSHLHHVLLRTTANRAYRKSLKCCSGLSPPASAPSTPGSSGDPYMETNDEMDLITIETKPSTSLTSWRNFIPPDLLVFWHMATLFSLWKDRACTVGITWWSRQPDASNGDRE